MFVNFRRLKTTYNLDSAGTTWGKSFDYDAFQHARADHLRLCRRECRYAVHQREWTGVRGRVPDGTRLPHGDRIRVRL